MQWQLQPDILHSHKEHCHQPILAGGTNNATLTQGHHRPHPIHTEAVTSCKLPRTWLPISGSELIRKLFLRYKAKMENANKTWLRETSHYVSLRKCNSTDGESRTRIRLKINLTAVSKATTSYWTAANRYHTTERNPCQEGILKITHVHIHTLN